MAGLSSMCHAARKKAVKLYMLTKNIDSMFALILNTVYWTGAVPFKFDQEGRKFINVKSMQSRARWIFMISCNSFLKYAYINSCFLYHFSNTSQLKGKETPIVGVIQWMVSLTLIFLGFLDIFLVWKQDDIFRALESTYYFYKIFNGKIYI
jgi:hypothetical protein